MKGVTAGKSILHPSFRYVPSYATDVRRTFARVGWQPAIVRIPGEPQLQTDPKPIAMYDATARAA
ncbi:MAG TPA: hypothetical protein VMT29_12700 [Steroidobacteraceae bacterium]|nr:hypothetical protein [Steroidobacteraceae bacterium]